MAFKAGVNTSVLRLAVGMIWLSVTATPPSVSVPTLGSAVIFTLCNVSEESTSLNGKLAAANVTGVSSAVVTELFDVVGGSFTGVTLTVIVAELLKTVPSLTWKLNVV